jgi:glutaredoxin
MNFAYFRKSTRSFSDSVAAVKKQAQEMGLTVGEEIKLPSGSVAIAAINPTWLDKVAAADRNLVGFVPGYVVILQSGAEVSIGISDPGLVGKIAHLHELHGTIDEMEAAYRKLVDEAAAAGPRRIATVKLYSTASCQYCKMEKAFLDEKGVKYEQIMVDTNQAAAQQMVEKTGQMGVPVTEVVYEDGGEEFMVGFDKPALSALLGIK